VQAKNRKKNAAKPCKKRLGANAVSDDSFPQNPEGTDNSLRFSCSAPNGYGGQINILSAEIIGVDQKQLRDEPMKFRRGRAGAMHGSLPLQVSEAKGLGMLNLIRFGGEV